MLGARSAVHSDCSDSRPASARTNSAKGIVEASVRNAIALARTRTSWRRKPSAISATAGSWRDGLRRAMPSSAGAIPMLAALPASDHPVAQQQRPVVLEDLAQLECERRRQVALDDGQRVAAADQRGRHRQEQLVDDAAGEQRRVEPGPAL